MIWEIVVGVLVGQLIWHAGKRLVRLAVAIHRLPKRQIRCQCCYALLPSHYSECSLANGLARGGEGTGSGRTEP